MARRLLGYGRCARRSTATASCFPTPRLTAAFCGSLRSRRPSYLRNPTLTSELQHAKRNRRGASSCAVPPRVPSHPVSSRLCLLGLTRSLTTRRRRWLQVGRPESKLVGQRALDRLRRSKVEQSSAKRVCAGHLERRRRASAARAGCSRPRVGAESQEQVRALIRLASLYEGMKTAHLDTRRHLLSAVFRAAALYVAS